MAREREAWRHKLRFAVALLLSIGVTVAIWAIWIRPVDTGGEFNTTEQDLREFSLLLFVLPPFVLALATGSGEALWRYVAAALVAPALAAVTAVAASDEWVRQDAAEQLFADYTHRFPAGHFDEPSARFEFEEKVLVTCAREDETDQSFVLYCLRMDFRDDPDGEVTGGYRRFFDEQQRSQPFDCFGVAEESLSPEKCGSDPR